MSITDSKANMTGVEENPDHPGGKKVTDPNAQEIRENAGPIASDSLAAESTTFQSSNRGAEPSRVKGADSTFATTDTSAAVTLEPTDVASSRPQNQQEYPDETAKMGHFTKSDKANHAVLRDVNLKNYHHAPGELDPNGNQAPTYVENVAQGADLAGGMGKVHGKNLHELAKDEKFDGEGRQPKGGAGAREDEDREAISRMQQINANKDTAGSGLNATYKGGNGSKFDNLNSEESA